MQSETIEIDAAAQRQFALERGTAAPQPAHARQHDEGVAEERREKTFVKHIAGYQRAVEVDHQRYRQRQIERRARFGTKVAAVPRGIGGSRFIESERAHAAGLSGWQARRP